jgi:NADPH2:quinone reductase
MEGAGIVDAVGENVSGLVAGDRVAYAMSLGAYAGYALVPAWRLVKVPLTVRTETAAAVMLQGMTAHYLSTYPIQEGDTVLVHAAAGGVGLLLVQMAKQRGAFVIGTASTPEKAELARQYGANEMINYTETDFAAAVADLTDGTGVHAVYDGVGQATFLPGLDCLRPRGMMVLYGQASGPVADFNPQILNQKGSLFLTRPSLAHYTQTQSEIQERASDLFDWLSDGKLKVRINRTFPLCDAALAHEYIEARQTKGKILLIPQHPNEPSVVAQNINTADLVDERNWESFPASDPPPY